MEIASMTSDAVSDEILTGLRNQRCEVLNASEPMLRPVSDAQVIEHLIKSSQKVLATMCGIEAAMDGPPRPGCAVNHFELSGVIGLFGSIRATVAINLPRAFAFQVVEKLTGLCPVEIDADVIDSVGELANIIVGATKRGLGDSGLNLEIPTVIFGRGHRITFSANMNLYVLPFTSDFGPLQLEVGIDA